MPVPPEFCNFKWVSIFIEHRRTIDNLPNRLSSTILNTSDSPSQSLIDEQCEQADEEESQSELHQVNSYDIDDDI